MARWWPEMATFFSEFESDELHEDLNPQCLECGWLDKRGNCRLRKCTPAVVRISPRFCQSLDALLSTNGSHIPLLQPQTKAKDLQIDKNSSLVNLTILSQPYVTPYVGVSELPKTMTIAPLS
jgi:hypothetical protein